MKDGYAQDAWVMEAQRNGKPDTAALWQHDGAWYTAKAMPGEQQVPHRLMVPDARGLRQSILSELKDIPYSGQFGVTNSQQPHGHQIGGPPVGAMSVRLLQVVSMCGQRTRSPLACCNHHKCQPGAGPASARTSSPSYHATRSGHDAVVVFVDRLSIALRPPPQLMMLKAQPSSSLRACTALMACLQRLSLTGTSVSL